jgi:hypothetical protein
MQSKSKKELIEIQKKCRIIWEDAFQVDGMLRYLAGEMGNISIKSHQKKRI